jgi:hypothetical protein
MKINITLNNVTDPDAVLEKGAELGLALISHDGPTVIFAGTTGAMTDFTQISEVYTGALMALSTGSYSTTVIGPEE